MTAGPAICALSRDLVWDDPVLTMKRSSQTLFEESARFGSSGGQLTLEKKETCRNEHDTRLVQTYTDDCSRFQLEEERADTTPTVPLPTRNLSISRSALKSRYHAIELVVTSPLTSPATLL